MGGTQEPPQTPVVEHGQQGCLQRQRPPKPPVTRLPGWGHPSRPEPARPCRLCPRDWDNDGACTPPPRTNDTCPGQDKRPRGAPLPCIYDKLMADLDTKAYRDNPQRRASWEGYPAGPYALYGFQIKGLD